MSAKTRERDSIETDIVEKNPHAVALGLLGGRKGGLARAETLSPKERQESARKAGIARMKKLSKAQRTEIGRKAVQARWNKAKAESSADASGV
jgi:hypothetical protein